MDSIPQGIKEYEWYTSPQSNKGHSLYFFWSYHSYAKDKFDFETETKNVQQVLDYAKQAGLYILARAGPYVNGETNNGGYALWMSDGSGGKVRTSDEKYHQAWLPYVKAVSAILAKNQISKGGPVIMMQVENELSETNYSATDTLVIYMQQLQKTMRDAGIVVPFFHNEKGMRAQSWSPGMSISIRKNTVSWQFI